MADFEKVIRKHTNDDGSIPADSIQGLAQAIADYVGKGFVALDRYNAKKNLADDLQEKLDAAEKTKQDYDKLKKDFEDYKADQNAKAVLAEKADAYKAVLKDLGIPEKRFAVIMRSVNLSEYEFADGKFKDAESVKKQAKEDWGDFIVSTQETGTPKVTPPNGENSANVLSRADIMKIKDTSERQKAWETYLTAQQKG